jgi:adenosylhomocysteine nucleosidase
MDNDMSVAGVVAALSFEARSLGATVRWADDLLVLADAPLGLALLKVSGMGRDRARRAALELVDAGADALLSWGTAGALDPALVGGSVLLATEVISPDEASGPRARFRTSLPWRKRIGSALATHAPVFERALFTCSTPVATTQAKANLFLRTGAAAVDMESAAVAEVAASHGLPFMAIRVIVDTAKDSLPEALVRALHAELCGESRRSRLALPVLRAPAQWGQLARLAWRYRRAATALRNCARVALAVRPATAWEADA